MWKTFVDRAEDLANKTSPCVLVLKPDLRKLPLPIQRFDDPFLPFTRAVVESTQDLLAGYILDFPAYLAMGAAGARALERSIGVIGKDRLKILHGPFAGPHYSAMMEATAFAVDAVTICSSADLSHYLNQPPYAAFVLETDGPDTVQQGGKYMMSNNRLLLYQDSTPILELQVLDDSFLYTGRGEDFANQIRMRILSL